MPRRPLHEACGAPPELLPVDAATGCVLLPPSPSPSLDPAALSAALRAHPASFAKEPDLYGRLPLHWLVRAATPSAPPLDPLLVQALLALHPDAARHADIRGLLPLHHACAARTPESVIELLLAAHEDAARAKDATGRLPLHHALLYASPYPQGTPLHLLSVGDAVRACKEGGGGGSGGGRTAWPHSEDPATGRSIVVAILPPSRSCQPVLLFDPTPTAESFFSWHAPDALLPIATLRSGLAPVPPSLATVARLLALHPAAVLERDENGRNALALAAAAGASLEVVEALLGVAGGSHAEAQARARDDDWILPLHLAAGISCRPDACVVRAVHDAFPAAVQTPAKFLLTALHMAVLRSVGVAEGSDEARELGATVALFLTAHPEAADAVIESAGFSAFHFAAIGSPASVVSALLPAVSPRTRALKTTLTGDTALHMLSPLSSPEAARMLVAALPPAEAARERNYAGKLPLHEACRRGAPLSVVRVLLDAYPQAVKDRENDDLATPLHEAAVGVFHQPQLLLALLDAHGNALKDKDARGALPLHHACAHQLSDAAVVARCLKEYPSSARQHDGEHRLPVAKAALQNAPAEVVSALLAARPITEKDVDTYGRTPLHCVSSLACDPAATLALVAACPGAARVRSKDGRLPLHTACEAAAPAAILRVLLAAYPSAVFAAAEDNQLPLHAAFKNESKPFPLDSLTLLLGLNPDALVAKTKKEEVTPLLLCLGRKSARLYEAQTLLAAAAGAGAGALLMSATNLKTGRFPLYLAVRNCVEVEAAAFILSRRPEAAKDKVKEGFIPLHTAVENCSPEHVALLLAAYPDGAKATAGDTSSLPLHFAGPATHTASVIRLLSVFPGAARHKRGSDGTVPLLTMCGRKGPRGAVSAVLDEWPDAVQTTDDEGKSALHLAAQFASIEVVDLVLDAHPPLVSLRSKGGSYPLHFATARAVDTNYAPVLLRLLEAFPEAAAAADAKVNSTFPLHNVVRRSSAPLRVVSAILDAHPEAVRMKEGFHGHYPLFYACLGCAPPDVLQLLIDAFPEAVRMQSGYNAQLPLHAALSNSAVNRSILRTLVAAYPESPAVPDGRGSLALMRCTNVRALDVVSELIRLHPAALQAKDTFGRYALHAVCGAKMGEDENDSSLASEASYKPMPAIIRRVLSGFPEAASKKSKRGRLPLHYLVLRGKETHGFGACVVLDDLLAAYPEGVREKTLDDKSVPLMLSLWSGSHSSIPVALTERFPGAASGPNIHGYTCLIYAFSNATAEEAAAAVFDADPDAIAVKDRNGNEPIVYLQKRVIDHGGGGSWSDAFMARVLLHSLPFDPVTGELRDRPRSYALTTALEGFEDKLLGAIELVLDRCAAHIEQLAHVTDKLGRRAIDLATPKCRKAISSKLYLLGRYQVRSGPAEHQSATSIVRYAQDFGDVSPQDGTPRQVVLKFMRSKVHFEREVRARQGLAGAGDDATVAIAAAVSLAGRGEGGAGAGGGGGGGGAGMADPSDPGSAASSSSSSSSSSTSGRVQRVDSAGTPSSPGLLRTASVPSISVAADPAGASLARATSGGAGPTSPRTGSTAAAGGENASSTPAPAAGSDDPSSSSSSSLVGAGPSPHASTAGWASYIVPILRSHDPDVDERTELEVRARKLDSHPYILVFPAADRAMNAIIDHEREVSGWLEEVRVAARQLAQALAFLHARGIIHGDVKARNIVREGRVYKLIDLDAAANFAAGEYVGQKVSSAFAPPEMLVMQPGSRRVLLRLPAPDGSEVPAVLPAPASSPSAEDLAALAPPLIAHPSQDIWALGATLFHALTGQTLLHSDTSDNAASDAQLRLCARWKDADKEAKLSLVPDPNARHLLSMLLYKDPARRPSADRLAEHPFLSGRDAIRLAGQEAEYDVFLSYRVHSDLVHAEALYHAFASAGLRVWWDRRCLETGKAWRDGFCNGLAKARAFLPLLSRGGMKASDGTHAIASRNWEVLEPDSNLDNVLLEHRLAVELKDRGLIEFVAPVFVGDEIPDSGDTLDPDTVEHGRYFSAGCAPQPAQCAVDAVEDELRVQLEREGLGTPLRASQTAAEVWAVVTGSQSAGAVEGKRGPCYEAIARTVADMLRPPLAGFGPGGTSVGAGAEDAWTASVDENGGGGAGGAGAGGPGATGPPSALAAAAAAAATEAADLRDQLSVARHELVTLRAAHSAAVVRLEGATSERNSSQSSGKASLSALQSRADAALAEAAAARDLVAAAKAEARAAQDQLRSHAEKARREGEEAAAREVAELRAALKSATAALDAAKAAAAKANAAAADAARAASPANRGGGVDREAEGHLAAAASAAQSAAAAAEMEAAAARSRLSDAEKALAQERGRASDAEARLAQERGRVVEAEGRLEAAREEVDRVRGELRSAREEMRAARAAAAAAAAAAGAEQQFAAFEARILAALSSAAAAAAEAGASRVGVGREGAGDAPSLHSAAPATPHPPPFSPASPHPSSSSRGGMLAGAGDFSSPLSSVDLAASAAMAMLRSPGLGAGVGGGGGGASDPKAEAVAAIELSFKVVAGIGLALIALAFAFGILAILFAWVVRG
jgi:ankyrin repeat protein/serine/threonine protein kinase